ncbi:hypothetical protein [Actinomadura sp. CNU-125]|nr:hypothetical protein [Actinomadura sp. CNU-125]
MARHRAHRPSWPMLVGLLGFAFILYVWVWAATQGGPPFWD